MNVIDRKKKEFIQNSGYYFKEDEIPAAGSPEMNFLTNVEINEKLDFITDRINTIKNCIVFFTVLATISLISSIISVIALIKIF